MHTNLVGKVHRCISALNKATPPCTGIAGCIGLISLAGDLLAAVAALASRVKSQDILICRYALSHVAFPAYLCQTSNG